MRFTFYASLVDGFLLIDKPAGVTSHDVVATIRRRLQTRDSRPKTRVGHAGTLDPMATGLLIVGVGPATKRLGDFLKLSKTYEAEITLGATSDTDDAEGVIREMPNSPCPMPKRDTVTHVLHALTGTLEQVPPAYSAVKIRGIAAYRRARRGEPVTLKPRRVTVSRMELLAYRFPTLRVRWTVSAGTYIRSLARDLGQALGTGAYLSALRRTAIGPHRVADALPLATLSRETILRRVRPTLP